MSEPVDTPKSSARDSVIADGDGGDIKGDGLSLSPPFGASLPRGSNGPLRSSPSSPNLLSRSTSFSNSSSYQEDWEVFPPLERITVFDLLDNIALPRQLEKFQTTLAAQTEKVRRQREKLKTSGISAKDRVVE